MRSFRVLLLLTHVAAATLLVCGLVSLNAPRRASCSAPPRYDVQEIILAGYQNNTAVAVSASGVVVGYGWNDNLYAAQPWLWESGKIRPLTLPRGIDMALPTGINAKGHVVGTGYKQGQARTGILWRGRQVTVFDKTSDDVRIALGGINDRGQVVGTEFRNTKYGTESQAFLWQEGKETQLGPWHAEGISSKGVVAGTEWLDTFISPSYALTCQPGKEPRHLSYSRKYSFSEARSINARGDVVGSVESRATYAAIWTRGKFHAPVNASSEASAINDAGQVVGAMQLRGDDYTAFLWHRGKLTRLQDEIPSGTACKLRHARGINRSGVIVGTGMANGARVGFVLTPRSSE